ncbi:putative Histidine kinase [uncultured delta proteobacterium]|uniref:histidine kinase n=1 Tax=uncultured delta proteobacterium TaxID=34034 RepID=A0A212K7Q6_9DELT|nr:putative Histidine kinase [uncultured delta proteobacterium]
MNHRPNWELVFKANYKQLLFVCAAFFLMVLIGCLSVSFVIQRETQTSVTVALSESEKTIQSYLREPRIAFNAIYMTVQDMLDRGESQSEIRAYLVRTTQSMYGQKEGVLGFTGVYGFIRDEFLDGNNQALGKDFIPQQRPWYQLAIRTKQAEYTAPYRDMNADNTGGSVISLAQEIHGKWGDYYGVLSLDIDLSWVITYAKSLQLREDGYGMIVNQYHYIIAHPNENVNNLQLKDLGEDYAAISDALRRNETVTAKRVRDFDGTSAIVFFRELYNGWYIGVVMPTRSYYADLYRTASILIALGISLTLFLSYLLLRLSAAKMQSDEENQSKSSFLAVMSHEIRTPLNAIIGLSEIQMRKDLPEATHNDLVKIYNSGASLLGIINDILDFSKIGAGGFELVPENYELPSMINDVVQLHLVRIGARPVTFILELDDTLPVSLLGDELRVKQILNNLLSNAFKYTRKGTVTLDIRWEQRENAAWITFRVIDTGIGIKKEDLGKLFKEYSQVDTRTNRTLVGTGLGLTITKTLAERMGGSIEVASEYGEGSVFTVTIRQEIIDPTPIGKDTAGKLKRFRFAEDRRARHGSLDCVYMPYARVLVVDDIPTNLDVTKGLLLPYAMKIDCVQSGQAAVERIRTEKVRYDAVFMDHMMPDMDGVEATRIIRQELGTDYARNIPIIALTANALVGNEEMLLSKGFNAFISKPIDTLRLDAILKEWICDRQPEETLHQAEQAKEEQARAEPGTNRDRARSGPGGALTGKRASGIDLQTLAQYYDSEDTCLYILRSYVKHTPALLEKLRAIPEGNLADYAITVHGLKGSSWNIGANEVGNLAEMLEHAAKKGDRKMVAANNGKLLAFTETLLAELQALLDGIDAGAGEKHRRETLDTDMLAAMLEANKRFDAMSMERTMTELEQMTYADQADTELILWLRDQLDNLEYGALRERLEAELARRGRS